MLASRAMCFLRLKIARRFIRQNDGAAAVEFGLVAAPFLALVFAIMETAVVFFAGQTLETAAADSARLVMTGQAQKQGFDQAKFKTEVCKRIFGLFNCSAGVQVDVRTYASFGSVNLSKPIDASGNLVNDFTYNPGGPGESGVKSAANLVAMMPPSVRERFDLVGFDQRGMGASGPRIDCLTDDEITAMRRTDQRTATDAGLAAATAEAASISQGCAVKTVAPDGVDVQTYLGLIGTREAARDLDVLRSALGEDQLSLVGQAYGSRVAREHVEKFPDRVRAMILDGVASSGVDQVADYTPGTRPRSKPSTSGPDRASR